MVNQPATFIHRQARHLNQSADKISRRFGQRISRNKKSKGSRNSSAARHLLVSYLAQKKCHEGNTQAEELHPIHCIAVERSRVSMPHQRYTQADYDSYVCRRARISTRHEPCTLKHKNNWFILSSPQHPHVHVCLSHQLESKKRPYHLSRLTRESDSSQSRKNQNYSWKYS